MSVLLTVGFAALGNFDDATKTGFVEPRGYSIARFPSRTAAKQEVSGSLTGGGHQCQPNQ